MWPGEKAVYFISFGACFSSEYPRAQHRFVQASNISILNLCGLINVWQKFIEIVDALARCCMVGFVRISTHC